MVRWKFAIVAVATAAALASSQHAAEAQSNAPPCVLRSLPPASVLTPDEEASLCALQGLAPVSALNNSDSGKAALERNFVITAEIQHGAAHHPTLLSFPEQQQQALRDAYMTIDNAYGLADGLGTRLGDAYQALTGCKSDNGGKTVDCQKNITKAVGDLIAYAYATTSADSGLGKNFFANESIIEKLKPAAEAILTTIKGTQDIFGKAYHLPGGSKGADSLGNSRPFQTEPLVYIVNGNDFFGVRRSFIDYLRGKHDPLQDLRNNPSYPSGHTTYGYTEGLLLALLVPERYPQMIARAAEYGNNRIILGAHYAMDVLAGRTLATYEMAQLLANTAGFVGVPRKGVTISDFRGALSAAKQGAIDTLRAGCGGSVATCAAQDQSRFANPARNRAFYLATQTYGLPTVFKQNVGRTEDVGKLAPEAGYLLCAAFPHLTRERANAILTETEGPGGGFLDDGSAFGVYSRLNLYRAAEKAIAEAPELAGKSRRHKVQRHARSASSTRLPRRNISPRLSVLRRPRSSLFAAGH